MRLPATLLALLGVSFPFARTATALAPGRAFDRFITIWLENQDFAKVDENGAIQALKKDAILLSNYYAQTHPSQPNYLASIAGDYFGLNHDEVVRIPVNVSTVVDLFDASGVSWAAYMEDIPSPGFLAEGSDNGRGDWMRYYVRKHNPFASFDSINLNGSRLLNIQGFSDFQTAFARKQLPQYSFITPNMLNDGHNTTLDFAADWSQKFLKPLLEPDAFAEKTLILLTYDESETYEEPNHIVSLLLGNAIPEERKGMEDNTVYTHYSILSTLEYNWQMPNLGRYDVGANVFQIALDLADNAGDIVNKEPPNLQFLNNSASYPGALSNETKTWAPYPIPNLSLVGAGGKGILDLVHSLWKLQTGYLTPYSGSPEMFDGAHLPVGIAQPVVGR